jgi:K+ transporter
MYSINVFLTFSISQIGMSIYFIRNREREKHWQKHLPIHLIGFVLCFTILMITSYEKFSEGGWFTIVITSSFILLCYLIRNHYQRVGNTVKELDELLLNIETSRKLNTEAVDPHKNTAIQLVSSYTGFGIHTFLSALKNFPNIYENFIFVSVAVVDSGSFKGTDAISKLEASVETELKKYVHLARKLGFAADYRFAAGTEVVETAVNLCKTLKVEFPKSTVFTGKLVFRSENFFHRMLHNQTAFAIQNELHWDEITSVILPIRMSI